MSRGSVQIGLNKGIPSHLESFEKTHTVAEEAEGTLHQVMAFQNWNIKTLL